MLIRPEFNDDDLNSLTTVFDAAAKAMGINGVKMIALLIFKLEHANLIAQQEAANAAALAAQQEAAQREAAAAAQHPEPPKESPNVDPVPGV